MVNSRKLPLSISIHWKILVFVRHADGRAKSTVLGTRISRRQEVKCWQKIWQKGAELHHSRSRLHGYFGFVNGERFFSLWERHLLPPLSLSLSNLPFPPLLSPIRDETAQRERRQSRLNGFLTTFLVSSTLRFLLILHAPSLPLSYVCFHCHEF